MLQGRLSESEAMLEELIATGLNSDWIRTQRISLLLARGDAEEAKPYVLSELEEDCRSSGTEVRVRRVEGNTWLFCILGDWEQAMQIAESFLTQLEGCDSPLRHASAAYSGYRTLVLATSAGIESHRDARARWHTGPSCLPERATRTTWRDVTPRRSPAPGGGLSSAGWRVKPAVTSFCAMPSTSQRRFGAYVALEPRLMLAEDLLAHGERDEGRGAARPRSGVEARSMGARRPRATGVQARHPITSDASERRRRTPTGPARPAHPARAGSARPARRRRHQPGYQRGALHHREDHQRPRQHVLSKLGRPQPRRCRGPGPPPRLRPFLSPCGGSGSPSAGRASP